MTLIRRSSEQARTASTFRSARGAAAGAPTTTTPAHVDPRDAQITALRAERDALAQQLAGLNDAVDEARAAAFGDGRETGRYEAESLEAERLEQLKVALREARSRFDDQLADDQDLGIEIALAALRRVMGDPAHYCDLVIATARHHAAALERTTVIQLAVSPVDFTDEAALAPLRAALGQIPIEIDPDLPAGGCRFDLTLGQLDAQVPAQANKLEALLIQTHPGMAERA